MKHDEFLTKVGQRADVSLETAEGLTAATLRTLAERISGGEAASLAAQLHAELEIRPQLGASEELARSRRIQLPLARIQNRSSMAREPLQ